MKRPSGTKIKKGGVGGSSPSVPISAYTSAETGGQARADLYEVHHRILHHQEHPILSRVESAPVVGCEDGSVAFKLVTF